MKIKKRLLEPHERIAEVLFGLIMVLTFTGSLSIAESGRDDVRTMLIGALGCNIAWGVIDGVLYLMGCLAEKSRNIDALRSVRSAADASAGHRLIRAALPSTVASVLDPSDLEKLRIRLAALPEPPKCARLELHEWLGALAVFLWVFCSTFPVAIPFIFINQVHQAMRVSNSIAVTMLFIMGFAYGRCVGRSPWLFGLSMVLLGGALVGLTITLGG
jgi:VIT1/CCC1 family predicted Fe2+/Mn2+ transporter